MRLGQEHEERHLATFPSHLDLGQGSIRDRAARTAEALGRGEALIYQGAFRSITELAGEDVEIVGVPDFLLVTPYGYAIRDSKLARRVEAGHPEIRLQLQLYGWLYEQTCGERPVSLQVHNGASEIVVIPYDGGAAPLAMLERIVAVREQPDPPPLAVGWSKCSACGYFERCWPRAERARSVGLLPGVDLGLASELESRGSGTIKTLRERFDVDTLSEVERPWGTKRAKVGSATSRRVLANALAFERGRPVILGKPAIPEIPNYVMFDLEGMPPQLDELEKVYLWGLQVFGENPSSFFGVPAEEGTVGDQRTWEEFLAQAESLFDRYGDRRGIAERVKGSLLDLLPITQESVALPLPSYSLKLVEGAAGFVRTLDGYGGDWSMARYIEATETNDSELRREIMGEIVAYNIEDLQATWAVLRWLQQLS
jgi:predicted RecB family nuclease